MTGREMTAIVMLLYLCLPSVPVPKQQSQIWSERHPSFWCFLVLRKYMESGEREEDGNLWLFPLRKWMNPLK